MSDEFINKLSREVIAVPKRRNLGQASDYHYILRGEDPDVISYKKFVLWNKLRNMDAAVKEWLDKAYPGLVDEVQLYLDTFPPNLVHVDEEIVEYVSIWWM